MRLVLSDNGGGGESGNSHQGDAQIVVLIAEYADPKQMPSGVSVPSLPACSARMKSLHLLNVNDHNDVLLPTLLVHFS